jgi:hypothetical protein
MHELQKIKKRLKEILIKAPSKSNIMPTTNTFKWYIYLFFEKLILISIAHTALVEYF